MYGGPIGCVVAARLAMSSGYDGSLDHLVYSVPDLARAVDEMEALLGVRPTDGGQHEALGTQNALVRLGPSQYLEIIGPAVDGPTPSVPRPFGIDALAAPTLFTWSVHMTGLEERVAKSRAAGHDPGFILPLSRSTADGETLQWKVAADPGFDGPIVGDGLVPFLVDWGNTVSPAESLPSVCRLVSLRGVHPDPTAIRTRLTALGVDLHVEEGAAPRLIASIETPSGTVELGCA